MNRIIIFVVAVLMVAAGCSKKQEAQTAAPALGSERAQAAQRLLLQSRTLLEQKDVQGAVESLKTSIMANPDDPSPYMLLGEILLRAEQPAQAVEFLDGAAKRFSDNPTIFYMLGLAYFQDKKDVPAALATRRSFELYNAAGDKENATKAAVLLQQIVNAAKQDGPADK